MRTVEPCCGGNATRGDTSAIFIRSKLLRQLQRALHRDGLGPGAREDDDQRRLHGLARLADLALEGPLQLQLQRAPRRGAVRAPGADRDQLLAPLDLDLELLRDLA